MATKVDIWNMALGHLGQSSRVAADTDTTVGAKACALFWDDARKTVLRAVAWPFATKIAAGTGKAANPNTDWAFVYDQPADNITVRRILDTVRTTQDTTKIPFRRAADKIWTNVDNAVFEYTFDVTDTTKYPSDFTRLLSLLLASLIAPQVAGGQQWALGKLRKEEYEAEVKVAAANAGVEEKNEPEEIVVGAKPKEEIVNAALGYLGLDLEVTDLTAENTLAARTARQFYNISRDDTLRALPWPFATKIAALAGKAATPNADWAFVYDIPADAITIRKILDSAGRIPHGQSRIPFKRATTAKLWTNQDNAIAEYTVQNDTATEYTADFKTVFAIKLALRMAPRFIKGADRKPVVEELERKLAAALQEAAANALMEERDLSPETVAATEPKENVCNAALAMLGLRAEIQDLETELTDEARTFRQFYSDAVDETFRSYDWAWARKTAVLAASAATPTEEWQYAYDYPADALAIRRVFNGSTAKIENEETRQTFETGYDAASAVDRVIYTDKEDAIAQYTVRVDDPLLWTADFRQALAALLASKVAMRLFPGKPLDKERATVKMYAHFKLCITNAMIADANEHVPQQDDESSLQRARN
jgi:hypothetical protein